MFPCLFKGTTRTLKSVSEQCDWMELNSGTKTFTNEELVNRFKHEHRQSSVDMDAKRLILFLSSFGKL
jgi:hypothetical protein